MRSKEADQKKAVKLLEQDLINGPRHCFGIHTHCSSDFCKHTKQGKGSTHAEDQNCGEGSENTIAGNYNTYKVVRCYMNDPFVI